MSFWTFMHCYHSKFYFHSMHDTKPTNPLLIPRITALFMEAVLLRFPAPLPSRTTPPPSLESNNTPSVHSLTLWMRFPPPWPRTAVWSSWRKYPTWRRSRWRRRIPVWVWIAWRWEPMTWRRCAWLRRWSVSNSNYSLPRSCAEWCWRLMMWLHRAIYNEFGVMCLLQREHIDFLSKRCIVEREWLAFRFVFELIYKRCNRDKIAMYCCWERFYI